LKENGRECAAIRQTKKAEAAELNKCRIDPYVVITRSSPSLGVNDQFADVISLLEYTKTNEIIFGMISLAYCWGTTIW